MNIRKELLGIRTNSKVLGKNIKVESWMADTFLKEGRLEMLEDDSLEGKPIKELRSISKDLEGYNTKLNKTELINLIVDATS